MADLGAVARRVTMSRVDPAILPQQVGPISRPTTVGRRYGVSIWNGDWRALPLRRRWDLLVAGRQNPGAVYQAPAYFDYLQEAEFTTSRAHLVTVHDGNRDRLAGVVPLKLSTVTLPFSFGRHVLAAPKLTVLHLLGSEPMVPQDPDVLDDLFQTLSERYPQARAVCLDTVQAESRLWRYLRTSPTIRRLYHVHVLHGLRPCHVIPIPGSVDEYLKKLSRKRRYNLQRQERLLQQAAGGAFELIAIDGPEMLPHFFEAIARLGLCVDADGISVRDEYESLARHGLLYCFVLKAGDTNIGLVVGKRHGDVYHVERLYYDKSLEKYSPGSTLWQVIFRHLIEAGAIRRVDMGYGSPTYQYRATNVIEQRGRVLLLRRTLANRCWIPAHSGYCATVDFIKRRLDRRDGASRSNGSRTG